MKLNKLPKTKAKSKKRVGRGYGSGKGGHTAGRGQKGQKSRNKVGLLFEGTKMRKSLIRRLPMRRGKLRFKSFKKRPFILNVKYLNLLDNGTEVDLEILVKKGLVDKEAEKLGVKVLGEGVLQKKLKVLLPVSKGARKKIEKAGGKVLDKPKPRKKTVRKAKKQAPKKAVKKATKPKAVKKTAVKAKTKKTRSKRGRPKKTK